MTLVMSDVLTKEKPRKYGFWGLFGAVLRLVWGPVVLNWAGAVAPARPRPHACTATPTFEKRHV